jgi:hypothetical protein
VCVCCVCVCVCVCVIRPHSLCHMCPQTVFSLLLNVSSYYCVCPLAPLSLSICLSSNYYTCVLILLCYCVSVYYYRCVLMLLHIWHLHVLLCASLLLQLCPHTTIYTSPSTSLTLLYMCPHTTTYMYSHYYITSLPLHCILLYVSSYYYMSPHTTIYVT